MTSSFTFFNKFLFNASYSNLTIKNLCPFSLEKSRKIFTSKFEAIEFGAKNDFLNKLVLVEFDLNDQPSNYNLKLTRVFDAKDFEKYRVLV